MAIYHFSVKNISRGDGRSAVAAAAYRSGEKLIDQRQGKEQDYTRKSGVEFKNIYAPLYTNRNYLRSRETLWNEVEKIERRKDAALAREFEIAFPHELNQRQREQLLDELCCKIIDRHSVIVDAVIHAPHTKSGSDERNYHAHIMFTSRHIDPNTGNFAAKKNRDFNIERSTETVKQWRSDFADLCNKYLELSGSVERVDHRSYSDQDNGLQPTLHEGSKITQLRRKGIDTEISLLNDRIKQQNAEKLQLPEILKGLEQEIQLHEYLISKYQSKMRLEGGKTTDTIKPSEQNKNVIQRDSRPSNSIKTTDLSLDDKKLVIQAYENKVRLVAEHIFKVEIEAIHKKLSEYRVLSTQSLEKIEQLRENKPLNPFKLKEWKENLDQVINHHNVNIKQAHDDLLRRLDQKQKIGVCFEHYEKAESEMYKKDKNAYLKIQELKQEIKERESLTVHSDSIKDQQADRGR